MELNRNNYEEYFLLYLDGELDAAGRNEVEAFLAANPDMAMEMQLLKDTILEAEQEEPIRFGDMELLLKPEAGAVISENNFEPFLLSYIDNELSLEDKAQTETFLSKYTPARAALEILQQTKLQPELSIVYPDKEELLKEEEKTRKIVYFRWQYVAVAAAMMGIFVTLWLNRSGTDNTEHQPAMAANEGKNSQPVRPSTTIEATTPANADLAAKEISAGTKTKETPTTKKVEQLVPLQENISDANNSFAANEEKRTPKAFTAMNSAIASNNTIEAPVTTITEKKGDLQVIKPEIAPGSQNALSTTLAANQKLEMPEEEVLLIGNTRINKSSMRGILRKTGRFLERTANVGESKASQLINGKSDNKKD